MREHRGRLADFTGDAFLAEFPSAVDATGAALAIQRESRVLDRMMTSEERFRLRIGVHMGDVREDDGRIYGDTIHIAARLQTLAEPGGVVLSASVHAQVNARLNLAARDLGVRELKHIAAPVHCFALEVTESSGEVNDPAPGFGGRSAIAVLPVENLSPDAIEPWLCDGITEDLIMRLASMREYPVIARQSTALWLDKSIDTRTVGRDLGAAWLVRGSLRRQGDRIRFTVQLIETATGQNAWAGRFDREFNDLFALQDEIVEGIIGSLHPELLRAERRRSSRMDARRLGAWDLALQADALVDWSKTDVPREQMQAARALAEQALRLDPDCVLAYVALGHAGILARLNGWPGADAIPGKHLQHVRDLVDQNPANAQALHALLLMATLTIDRETTEQISDRLLGLEICSPRALYGLGIHLAFADRGEDALAVVRRLQRINPHENPFPPLYITAIVHLGRGRYADAYLCLQQILPRRPSNLATVRLMIGCCAELGHPDEMEHWKSVHLGRMPDYSVSVLTRTHPFHPEFLKRFANSLRKAGFPE